MRLIAASGAIFISRGDASGTYAREQELWALAKQRPSDGRRLETGQGMSATLRVAHGKRAHTLADRATFEQVRPGVQLTVLFEGGAPLLNTYSVFLRAGLTAADQEVAIRLANWTAACARHAHRPAKPSIDLVASRGYHHAVCEPSA
jgi:tungstate transport system substrate-binding protein